MRQQDPRDVYRDEDGNPVTITDEQSRALWHAFTVWQNVHHEAHGEYPDLTNLANVSKSRLLGRMLFEGKPPLPHPPPLEHAGGWYGLIEEGSAQLDGPSGMWPSFHFYPDRMEMNIYGHLWTVVSTDEHSYTLKYSDQSELWSLRPLRDDEEKHVSGYKYGTNEPYSYYSWILERIDNG